MNAILAALHHLLQHVWSAHVKTVYAAVLAAAFGASCCAGAIPFLALSPPVAAALPLLPVDLVANAGSLQACAVSLLVHHVPL